MRTYNPSPEESESRVIGEVMFEIAGLQVRLGKLLPSRQISLTQTKLDEARHWLRAHRETLGEP